MAATSHAPVSTRTAKQQRNTHGRSSSQRLSNENNHRETLTERTKPPVTQLICNMFGLHPQEVALAYNVVSAWFRGVRWEKIVGLLWP